jgi:hypothetical protein
MIEHRENVETRGFFAGEREDDVGRIANDAGRAFGLLLRAAASDLRRVAPHVAAERDDARRSRNPDASSCDSDLWVG